MKLLVQSPKKQLKAFFIDRPTENERDKFKKNLLELLDKINLIEKQPKDESEEHLKNNIRDFLRDTYYLGINAINTKDKKDLVIHEGKTTDTDVAIIIEAKRPSNTREMVTPDNANKKAFHELVLYYLNERHTNENVNLKQLIITDINQWFVIDANFFDKSIYRNTSIKKLFNIKLNDKKDNPWFYEELSKILAKINYDIPCVYFDLRQYEKILRNDKEDDDKELLALYKILSPSYLLKLKSTNDNNALNEKFYKELLHIIGLEESNEKNKKLIKRKNENRENGSLIELTLDALKTENTFHRIPDINFYGQDFEEQSFNIALELCITWINRILFLKLLEGQLISYHQGDSSYRFLNIKQIPDFDELFKLFHKVLAVNITERSTLINSKYSKVPYLNSSLFEISLIEDQTVKINSLDNNSMLSLYSTTVLKDVKKSKNALPTLEYLLFFLEAFDFASEGTEEWQKENKQLINASVLGKVFEKINGYRDGSIFTPAFITMYMCRESIRLAIVEKFNEKLAPQNQKIFDSFDDLKNYTLRNFKTNEVLLANKIFNSLKICDPAVGSGHFLVSALNELIVIKSELGILSDNVGNILSGYEIEIINDELFITDREGNPVQYKLNNSKPISKDLQKLQKTLFSEKQTLIENCLFGVDINPKSVLICRLRLWIELLKHAYYKEPDYLELETLPNIDLNIKCGNSLLNRFPLDSDLNHALKSINYTTDDYKYIVQSYKNEKNREVKRQIENVINTIKEKYREQFYLRSKENKDLQNIRGQYLALTTANIDLFGKKVKGKDFEIQKLRLEKRLEELESIVLETKNNALYKNAFEWRFEFPEVLSSNSEFEGFDLIIQNPPYVYRNYEYQGLKKYFSDNYSSAEGNFDLYKFFVEKSVYLTKDNYYSIIIIPNTFLTAKSYSKLRKLLIDNTVICEIFDLGENIFEGITVENVILLFKKIKGESDSTRIKIKRNRQGKFEELEKDYFLDLHTIYNAEKSFNIYLDSDINTFIKKIRLNTVKLNDIAYCTVGINTGYIKSELTSSSKINETYHKLLTGKDIGLNKCNWSGEWIKYDKEFVDSFGDRGRSLPPEYIFTNEKILVQRTRRGMSRKLVCYYDINQFYNLNRLSNIISTDNSYSLKYIHAILNSDLMDYYFNVVFNEYEVKPVHLSQLPIKKCTESEQMPFINLVDKIIKSSALNIDTSDYEHEINKLVYDLYDVSSDEREKIETFKLNN